MKKPETSLRKNESGIVSLMLTIFVMIILTLIVVGFSEITRREERQSLDRQLSTQAFYAAESGVNLTVNTIRKDAATAGFVPQVTTCGPVDLGPAADTLGTSVPCVLYDAQPKDLEYTAINQQAGKIVPLNTLGGFAPGLSFEWNVADAYSSNYSSCPSNSRVLVALSPTCPAGYLRATIMTLSAGASREALYASSFTVFFKPVSAGGGGSVAYVAHGTNDSGAAGQGQVIPANCSGGVQPRCKATITGIPTGAQSYLHLRSMFKNNTVKITSTDPLDRFTRAQIKVDATGKVSDVLRRIQVRVSYLDDYEIPSYVIDGEKSVCKSLTLRPGIAANANNTSPYVAPAALDPRADDTCSY